MVQNVIKKAFPEPRKYIYDIRKYHRTDGVKEYIVVVQHINCFHDDIHLISPYSLPSKR